MIARQQYEQELRELQEGEDDEEGVLDVYDEADHAEGQMDVDDTPILRTVGVKPKDKGKGKANAKQLFDDTSHAPTNSMHSVTVSSKRRRPLMDPFAASGPSHLIYNFLFIHIPDHQGLVLGKKRANLVRLAFQPYQTRNQNPPSRVTETHHFKQGHRLQIS